LSLDSQRIHVGSVVQPEVQMDEHGGYSGVNRQD